MSNKLKGTGRRRGTRERGAALEHGLLPGLLGYQLRLAQLAVFRDFERHVGSLGVSPGRVGVLALIGANPGVTQGELARAVGLDRSTMVPLLDRFEKRGVLERRRGADRRTNGLWLTAPGRRLLAQVEQRIQAHEERIASRLSAVERRQLMALLRKILPDS
jgi:DNA-binding MarR family transcriptional regulator